MRNPETDLNRSIEIVGYVPINEATPETYSKLGFKCGLEIHQQLKTSKKLFCRCPAGIYLEPEDFNAEIIRHMRPTLSELGEYDGTALMEFRTKKNITYRLNNINACTYEIDDTPPFPINSEALEYALEIAHLLKTSIVGELHITRKQYLDGSIPTGFQRTAIVGINGTLPLSNKDVGVIQLGIEEDSCREISDIGHERIYITDRLGMPLIEVVTEPELLTPDEAAEAGNYIRFLTRSSGRVRTGIGAGRQDVNVSITGGTRVEIKGVAHIKWIPALTHNEAFRQKALLEIAGILKDRPVNKDNWKAESIKADPVKLFNSGITEAENAEAALLIRLPHFKNIPSFFTQPGKNFSNELSDRLKVIACLEKPNMIHSESGVKLTVSSLTDNREFIDSLSSEDAWIALWGPEADMATAFETIDERCSEAFSGVPSETRKSLPDGTTLFERVLPGPDRMYPDTDSAPVSITSDFIERTGNKIPLQVSEKLEQLRKWNVPEDSWIYILKKNIFNYIKNIVDAGYGTPVYTGVIFGQVLKHMEGQHNELPENICDKISSIFRYISEKGIPEEIVKYMLPELIVSPDTDPLNMKALSYCGKLSKDTIISKIPELRNEYKKISHSSGENSETLWIMGQLKSRALGNIELKTLRAVIEGGEV